MRKILLILGLYAFNLNAQNIIISNGNAIISNNKILINYIPKNIPNLLAWYDCSDISTIVKDGSNYVSSIQDKGDNNYDIIQSIATNQPLYSNNSIIFDGADNYLNVVIPTKPANYTIIAVIKTTKLLTNRLYLFGSINSSEATATSWGFCFNDPAAAGKYNYGVGNGVSRSTGYTSNVSFAVNTVNMIAQRFTSGSNYVEIFSNNVNYAVTTTNTGATTCAGTAYKFSIGRAGEYNGYYWGGVLFELIIYNRALTSFELNKISTYLNQKYLIY